MCEGGGNNLHLAHAIDLDATALKRCAGHVKQLVAAVRVGAEGGAGFGTGFYTAAGQQGLHKGAALFVGFVSHGLHSGVRTGGVGGGDVFADLREQAGLDHVHGQRGVCQHFGLQGLNAGTGGEGFEHGQHLGVVVFGAGEGSGWSRRGEGIGH